MTYYSSVNCIVSAYYFLLQVLIPIQGNILSMETNYQNFQTIAPLFSSHQDIPKIISLRECYGLAYFYSFCRGYIINKQEPNKQQSKDYIDGFFIVIHEILKSKVTLFFLKRGKQGFVVESVNRVEGKEVNVNRITRLSDDGRRLNIYYQNGSNTFHIKFASQDHVRAWKTLFYFYRPDLKDSSKIKHERCRHFTFPLDSSEKLGSTNSSQKRENTQNLLACANPYAIIKQEEKDSSRISDQGKNEEFQEPLSRKEELERREKRELSNEVERLSERLRLSEGRITQLLLEKDEEQTVLKEEIGRLSKQLKIHLEQQNKQQALRSQNTKTQHQLKKCQKELQEQKRISSTLNERIQYLEKLINECEKNHKPSQQKLKNMIDIEARQKKIAQECSQKISKVSKQIQKYIQKARQLQDQCDKYHLTIQLFKYSHLFTAQIFQNEPIMKKELALEIQTFSRRKIARTRLIYKMDPLNKVNFHHYIDGKSNFVVIARTATGFYLAAFSESSIMPKSIASDGGLLISLSNKKSFKCLPQRRSVVYDDYYIIFGNSQFRIRSQQAKIFSNFGIANCHYASNDHKVDVLLGTSVREVDLDSYEVYQILFQ